jgi:hypothetical protein
MSYLHWCPPVCQRGDDKAPVEAHVLIAKAEEAGALADG